jgi:phage terminase large subunit-like protein
VFKIVSKPNTGSPAYTLDNIACTKCISVIYLENEAGDSFDAALAIGGTITMTTTTSAIHFLKMLQADVQKFDVTFSSTALAAENLSTVGYFKIQNTATVTNLSKLTLTGTTISNVSDQTGV